MTWPRTIAAVVMLLAALLMLNILVNDGLNHGVGLDTFLAGVASPWQLFIDQDLVNGLLFTVGWVVFRERGGRVINTVAWAWMALWWGNSVIGAYVLLACAQCQGDWHRFFLGRRAGVLKRIWNGAPLQRGASGFGAVLAAAYLAHGLSAAHFAGIATFGYVAAFTPVILSLVLLAFPARSTENLPVQKLSSAS
jgi:hypothetical protein